MSSARVVGQVQAIHLLKRSALRMFDPMLVAVAAERKRPYMAQVEDLLGKMHDAFGAHREQTAAHERLLRGRLAELGAGPASRFKLEGAGAGAALRARLGAIGGQDHGANARDAFVFEHLEIALLELLVRLADRGGDETTASVARRCLADDRAMAEKITNNLDNVLSPTLASRKIPVDRPASA